MDFYLITLEGMKKLLSDCSEELNASYIADCIDKWNDSKDVDYFLKGFSEKGVFAGFNFAHTDFESEEKKFWVQQLFGGLVAMAMQLAKFQKQGRTVSIAFIRQNFGHRAEVIRGAECEDCRYRQINSLDIDRYIVLPVVSTAIVNGLDNNDLNNEIDKLVSLKSAHMRSESDNAKLRASNTDIVVVEGRQPLTVCPRCGSKKIKSRRFLKSLKNNSFVALSK